MAVIDCYTTIDDYVGLVNEATTLYNSFEVVSYCRGIEYIKDLQKRVQGFPIQNIENELINDTPNTGTLQRRLDFVEMKLENKLIEFEEGDKGDFLNDNRVREQFFIEKMGREVGMEYTIRLASILEWLASDSTKIIKLIDKLRSLGNSNPQQVNQQIEIQQPEKLEQKKISYKPTRGKGRPKETLKDKMINDDNGNKLNKIHIVMNGKKGKDAALIVLACISKGWMQKPTFTQITEEFGDIGTQQGFTKYLNKSCFTDEEIKGAINSLD